MKLYYAALLALSLFYTGCMKQDYSDCMDIDNFRLDFDYKGDSGILTDHIKSIDALIFDGKNQFVTWEKRDESQLREYPGIILTLDPGEYRVVCWGNLDDNTVISNTNNRDFSDMYIESVSGSSAHPLYYAPEKKITDRLTEITRAGDDDSDYSLYTVTVKPNTVSTKELSFTRVYRSVRVFIKGYKQAHEQADPQVKINNMPVNYDFFLRTGPSRKDYQTATRNVVTEDGEMLLASFNNPITDFANDMLIEIIRTSDSQTITTLNLMEYVQDNMAEIPDLNQIDILISYTKDGVVDISLPAWGSQPLTPEW